MSDTCINGRRTGLKVVIAIGWIDKTRIHSPDIIRMTAASRQIREIVPYIARRILRRDSAANRHVRKVGCIDRVKDVVLYFNGWSVTRNNSELLEVIKGVIQYVDAHLRTPSAVNRETATHIVNYIVPDDQVLDTAFAFNHASLKTSWRAHLRNTACVLLDGDIDGLVILGDLEAIDVGIAIFWVGDPYIVDNVFPNHRSYSINVYAIRVNPAWNIGPSRMVLDCPADVVAFN